MFFCLLSAFCEITLTYHTLQTLIGFLLSGAGFTVCVRYGGPGICSLIEHTALTTNESLLIISDLCSLPALLVWY